MKGCAINGSLGVFSHLPHVTHVGLSFTNVTGSISVFGRCSDVSVTALTLMATHIHIHIYTRAPTFAHSLLRAQTSLGLYVHFHARARTGVDPMVGTRTYTHTHLHTWHMRRTAGESEPVALRPRDWRSTRTSKGYPKRTSRHEHLNEAQAQCWLDRIESSTFEAHQIFESVRAGEVRAGFSIFFFFSPPTHARTWVPPSRTDLGSEAPRGRQSPHALGAAFPHGLGFRGSAWETEASCAIV